MSLTFTYPVLLIVLALLLAAAATYWVYRRTTPELGTARRFLLGFLRFFVLALIVVLLAEPIWQSVRNVAEPPVLAALVDESESMSLAGLDSAAAGRTADQLLADLAGSTTGERLRIFGFGGSTREAPSFDSLRFTESRTDIAAGLEELRSRLENEALGAVVLISDGRYTGGRNPEYVADLYPVPIVSIVVGDTTIRRDIRIQQVLKNDLSYVGREVPVRVRIRNEDVEPVPISVQLSGAGSNLDAETVTLPPPGSELEVELSFVPDSVGLFQYRVDITRLEDELTHRNNAASFSLQILERERRILLMAGAPSPDVAAIRQQLVLDSDTEVVSRTVRGTPDGSYYEGPLTDDLNEFDLIVFIGYPAANARSADLDRVLSVVEGGTPLLFIMDRSADLVAIQQRVAPLIPVRPALIRSGYVQGGFVPTEDALRHAVFDIPDRRNSSRWNRLPPLTLGQSRWERQTGAVTLAITRIRGISIDDPLLVVGRIGTRRSAALLASGMWRWSNVPEDLADEASRWRELFSNLILWLVTEDDDRLVRVAPVETLIDESDPVSFTGQVYDENLNPLSDVSLSLQVRNPAGEIFPYVLQSLGNGQYRADLGSFPQGTYTYEATATVDAGPLGTDRGSFTVGALSAEFRNPYADIRLMRQLAQRSGGATVSAARIDELPAVLSSLSSYRPTVRQAESQVRLWRMMPLLAVLIVLMTAEWFFRKLYGLV